MKTPFLGSAYTSWSKNLADQRLVNMYPEFVEEKLGKGKAVGAFYGTPGLDVLVSVGDGPIRGLLSFTPQGSDAEVLYVISGFEVYKVAPDLTTTHIGTLNTLSAPNPLACMVDNGAQVAIFDEAFAYSIVSDVLAPISLPFMNNPGIATYQDGFVLLSEALTFNLWQSNLNDLTTWDSLNFTTEDGQPDNIIALADLHRQVVVLKENHIAFYINAGNAGFAFQRIDGVYPNTGCAAALSAIQVGELVGWLGRNEEGGPSVYLMGGYQPERFSTYPLESRFANYATVSDAVAYSYSQAGHLFYVLTFPTANETWALDVTSSKQVGYPVWHQEGYFTNGVLNRGLPQCAAFFGGQHVAGDCTSGNVYALNRNSTTHNGRPIKRLRSWRALPEATDKSARFSSLEIDMETGIGVPDGTNPLMVLRYSDDGGHNWSCERFQPAGRTGETSWRVKFNRLGMERRGLSNDRIFELSTTDQFKVSWLGAELN